MASAVDLENGLECPELAAADELGVCIANLSGCDQGHGRVRKRDLIQEENEKEKELLGLLIKYN